MLSKGSLTDDEPKIVVIGGGRVCQFCSKV